MGQYDTTLGVFLIGTFFNTYLFGLVSYQFALYYWTNFNDRLHVKCTVLFLFIIDVVHSAGAIYMAWGYAVAGFDNPVVLQYELWPHPFTPIGTAAAALTTHILLTDRIWRLTGSKVLYVGIIFSALITFCLGVSCGTWAWAIKATSEIPRTNSVVIAWLTMQVALDAFITGALSITLCRAKTGLPPSDTVIQRLIRGAIQTGLFASVFALCDLACFLWLPTTWLYLMFAIPIGRIYSNTLLDTLLVRERLRAQLSSSAFERTSMVLGWLPSEIRHPAGTPTPDCQQAEPSRQQTNIVRTRSQPTEQVSFGC